MSFPPVSVRQRVSYSRYLVHQHDGRVVIRPLCILTFVFVSTVATASLIGLVYPQPSTLPSSLGCSLTQQMLNFLMLQLIKVVAEGPNTVNDINGLPSSTSYSSSTIWNLDANAYLCQPRI
jgi:hypothetical protein